MTTHKAIEIELVIATLPLLTSADVFALNRAVSSEATKRYARTKKFRENQAAGLAASRHSTKTRTAK